MVRLRYARGAVEVRSWNSPGAVEVQSACGAVEVYAHGAVDVRSWYGRSVEVRSWYGLG